MPIKSTGWKLSLIHIFTLLECMREAGVKKFVFSSSATVYGEENDIPYIETMKRGSCSNPVSYTHLERRNLCEK